MNACAARTAASGQQVLLTSENLAAPAVTRIEVMLGTTGASPTLGTTP